MSPFLDVPACEVSHDTDEIIINGSAWPVLKVERVGRASVRIMFGRFFSRLFMKDEQVRVIRTVDTDGVLG